MSHAHRKTLILATEHSFYYVERFFKNGYKKHEIIPGRIEGQQKLCGVHMRVITLSLSVGIAK